jgi:hypothetical protein
MLMLISTIFPVSTVNAAFLEDYSATPTKKSLNTILNYCQSNPDGNIANDLVNTSKISEFYADYSCDRAAEDKAWLEGNQSSSNTTITILH